MRPDRQNQSRSLRNAFDAHGEVRIGARARRELVRRIVLGVIGVGMIAAAAGYYLLMRPRGAITQDTRIVVRSASTGEEFLLPVDPARVYPTVGPNADQRDCYPVWRCQACGRRFVVTIDGQPAQCPDCASTAVGAAKAAEP